MELTRTNRPRHPRSRTSRSLGASKNRRRSQNELATQGERVRTWNTTSQRPGEPPSTSAIPPTATSWPESMLTGTGSYTLPTLAAAAPTYGYEQARRNKSSTSSSSSSRSDSTSDSGQRITPDDFQYDWESVFPGYNPKDANWEDPRPMADSPPNPRRPGYYAGPTTSQLIAGASEGEVDMGDVADPWARGAPQPPEVPQQPAAPPPD